MQNPPNDSYKEESGPEPLSNFLDLGKGTGLLPINYFR